MLRRITDWGYEYLKIIGLNKLDGFIQEAPPKDYYSKE